MQKAEALAHWKVLAMMGAAALSYSIFADYIYSTPLLGTFMAGKGDTRADVAES